MSTGRVFGAGEYQQARDGKTMIWNWQPKPGETPNWSGDRDKDNYASGFGDLTWYNAEGKVFGLFYGKMAHGKFEGGVNVHTGGRVAHAYFVDGERVTSWARGGAKSTMTGPEAAVVEKRKAEAEKVAAKKQNVERAEPVQTPAPKKEKPEKIAKAETVASPAEKTAPGPDSYHKEAGQKPASSPAAEKETEPLSAEDELKRTEASPTRSATQTFAEPTALPKSKSETETRKRELIPLPTSRPSEPEREVKESPPPTIQETPPELHQTTTEPTPEIAEKKAETKSPATEESRTSSSAPAANENPADISLKSLVGPPSSLRTNSIPESSPPEKSRTEREAPPRNDGQLNETEAINLADTEARNQGLDLDNYERPKVDHSQVKGRWTLFYGVKKSESRSNSPAFTVTVEDKTRKAELKK